MDWKVFALVAGLAAIAANASIAGADTAQLAPVQIAQNTAESVGPVTNPGGNMNRPRGFPSSSGASVFEGNPRENEDYSAAIQNCQTLPHSQRAACIDDIDKRFGRM